MSDQDNRNATQKIQDLENALMALYQTADAMAKDLATVKDAIKLLGNKVDSLAKASLNGEQPTDAVISRIMIENNVEELAQKVKIMVAQGVLSLTEQVASDSFLVGSEQNDLGETINPCLQFALFAINPPELQEKFIGARAGDLITISEGRPKYKVKEVYQIQKQKSEEAVPTASSESEASAPAAAAEQSSQEVAASAAESSQAV